VAPAAEPTEAMQRNTEYKETQVLNREAQVDFIMVISMYRDISALVLNFSNSTREQSDAVVLVAALCFLHI